MSAANPLGNTEENLVGKLTGPTTGNAGGSSKIEAPTNQ